jgi:hypothetical protein
MESLKKPELNFCNYNTFKINPKQIEKRHKKPLIQRRDDFKDDAVIYGNEAG